VGRPAQPPRGGSAALSWGRAAIRGHNAALAWARMSLRPTRTAFRRPPGSTRTALPNRLAPDGGPPFAFAPLQRSIAALPHRPAGRTGRSDDASSPGLSCPTTHDGMTDPRGDGGSTPRPACRARGFSTPFAASTDIPLDARRRRSVHGLPPSRPSPHARSVLLSEPMPSGRYPRRFAAPPWGADGRGRLQGLVPGASSFCERPFGRARRCLPGVSPLQGVPPLRPGSPLWSRGLPLHATRRDVHDCTRPGVSGNGEVGWSLSGLPALLGSSAL